MHTLLIIILILSGIVFIWSALLMSPKWWIGMGIWWVWWGGNEYGSKKSLEWKVKKIATISIAIFIVAALLLPYSK
jgi:hypothetical protein